MGKLFTIGNTTVRVYSRDHRPAHVDVTAPDCEALIRLDTLAFMCGQLPIAHRREIMRWIEEQPNPDRCRMEPLQLRHRDEFGSQP